MKKNESIQEIMYSYLEKWRTTNLDMKRFCRNHNISYYSFKYWKYRQRDEISVDVAQLPSSLDNPKNGKFLPMQIETESLVSGFILNYPSGVRLSCPSNMSLDYLVTLIKAFQILKRQNLELSDSTLNGWFNSTTDLLEPLYDALAKELLEGDYLQADESPIGVQDSHKQGALHTGYQ